MANFFSEMSQSGYTGALTSAVPATGFWGTLLGVGTGYLAQKDAAKVAAEQAQRDFELAKLRAQADAARSATMPGAPSAVQGGTGLAPGIPTWALVGAGVGLLVLVVLMRK